MSTLTQVELVCAICWNGLTVAWMVGKEDSLAYRALCQAVHDVNAGKVQLLSGKIVPVEKEEQ